MKPEDLMIPRKKVITDFPGNIFKVGDILYICKTVEQCEDVTDRLKVTTRLNDQGQFDKYPGIFKDVSWWEEREEKDMPEYVKGIPEHRSSLLDNTIYKVTKWMRYENNPSMCCTVDGKDDVYRFNASALLPSTETEYLTQNKKP